MSLKKIFTSAVVVIIFILTLSQPSYSQSSFSNVKVTFASTNTLPSNSYVLRWGSQSYQVEDQLFLSESCLRPVYPYGSAIPNGVTLSFPGNVNDNQSLAYQCFWVIDQGSCRRVSGYVLANPDVWGVEYIVTSISGC